MASVWLLLCLFALPFIVQASSNCNVVPASTEPIKVIVPLYVYPGSAWDKVAAAAATVDIVAIVNPNSGPNPNGPDSSYTTYMNKLRNAGVTLIGYIHTSYGSRSSADVEAEINTYKTKYPGLQGIFLDEASNSAQEIGYYTTLYHYITQNSGYSEVFLNPGTSTDEGYLAISTNIMIYEDSQTNLATTNLPSFVLCSDSTSDKSGWKYRFSGVAYGASVSQMPSLIASFQSKGVGYVYISDGAGGCCTYNSLASYFTSEISSINQLN